MTSAQGTWHELHLKKRKKPSKEDAKVKNIMIRVVHPKASPTLTLGAWSSKEMGRPNKKWQQYTPRSCMENSASQHPLIRFKTSESRYTIILQERQKGECSFPKKVVKDLFEEIIKHGLIQ